MFEAEQAKLPEERRRPCPTAPPMFEEIIAGGADVLKKGGGDAAQRYNEDAFNNFNTKALEPCEFCGRTFLPDRLIVHLRSCRPKNVPNEEEKEEDMPR